jgi:hypothetical protein
MMAITTSSSTSVKAGRVVVLLPLTAPCAEGVLNLLDMRFVLPSKFAS